MTKRSRLPTFVVIGAMKAGTTSLYRYLDAHPDVFMARPKEVDFFVEELNWHRGVAWYRERFSSAPASAIALGEASTSYTKYPRYRGVPERAARMVPEARLVYVVRDPVDRIRSHYDHNVVLGEEADPLERAIVRNPAYLDYSRYATQLARWLEWFPEERLLVTTAEALRSDRARSVSAVLSFLGVDETVPVRGLDVEHYRTEARPAYPRPVTAIRGMLRRAVPNRPDVWRGTFLPERVRRALAPARDAPRRTDPSPEIVARIRGELAEEVASLRRFLPTDFDGWESRHVA